MPTWLMYFQYAISAVQAVQAVATAMPVPPENTAKKAAAVKAVTDTINAAVSVSTEAAQLQAAMKSQDPVQVSTEIGHSIEAILSVCKSFGFFSKAAVVQNAAPVGVIPPSNIGG